MATKDKYDEAIEYLTAHPEEIYASWFTPSDNESDEVPLCHELFKRVSPDCGCLVQYRAGEYFPIDDITKEIAGDLRIPDDPEDIAVEHLPVFAEWQRRLDEELGR